MRSSMPALLKVLTITAVVALPGGVAIPALYFLLRKRKIIAA